METGFISNHKSQEIANFKQRINKGRCRNVSALLNRKG
nr:MAG TPA: hypothetical protein [Caudoviricetes sp.]